MKLLSTLSRIEALSALLLLLLSLSQPALCDTKDFPPMDERTGLSTSAKVYAPYPAPNTGYVSDYANLLSDEEENEIELLLWQAEAISNVEIAVVTINRLTDYKAAPSNIEDFAWGLFDAYGVGNLPKNDGVLLLVSRYDRKLRIQLGAAYGYKRDKDAQYIIDHVIVPHFKNDQYASGIHSGVEYIMEEFAGVRVRFYWELIVYPILIVILGFAAINMFKYGQHGWAYILIATVIWILVELFQTLVFLSRILPDDWDSDNWGSGGFGGGFGGGFSGGGGASGGW